MRKFNRKTADPVILNAYEELRYERRYPKLGLTAQIFRGLAYASIVVVMFLPADIRLEAAMVWAGLVVVSFLVHLVLLVAWKPSGERLQAAVVLLVILGVVALLFAGYAYGMDRWMSSLS